MLKWPPDTFWSATLVEFDAAIAGHLESIGAGEAANDAPSLEQLEDLQRYVTERESLGREN